MLRLLSSKDLLQCSFCFSSKCSKCQQEKGKEGKEKPSSTKVESKLLKSICCDVFIIFPNSVVNRWTSKNPGAQTTTTGEKTHSSMTMLKTMIICHRLLLPLFPAYCFKKSTAKRIRLLILYSSFHPSYEKPGCILSSKLWSVGTNPQECNNLVTGIKVRANRAGGVEPVSGNLMMVWPSRLIHREELAGLKQCQCLFLQS